MEAFPLHWPEGYPRTKFPTRARFQTTMAYARDGIMDELRKMGASHIVISTDIPLRLDGLPYASRRPPEDKGVAVYFQWQKVSYSLACDKWDQIGDNMQAIRKSIEALRGLDRWGVSDMLKRSFQGFKALPESSSESCESWWIILDCSPEATPEEIKSAYRKKIKEVHPDKGNGNADLAVRVNNAYKEAMEAK